MGSHTTRLAIYLSIYLYLFIGHFQAKGGMFRPYYTPFSYRVCFLQQGNTFVVVAVSMIFETPRHFGGIAQKEGAT